MSKSPRCSRRRWAAVIMCALIVSIYPPLTALSSQEAPNEQLHTEADTARVMLPFIQAGGNRAPVAVGVAYQIAEDSVLNVDAGQGVLANDIDADSDPLEARREADVAHGTLELQLDGAFTYTPAPNFHGQDSFTYRAHDGRVPSNAAEVVIVVTPVNDAPVATDDSYQTPPGIPLNVTATEGVLRNDTDVEGDALTATLVQDVTHGTLSLDADGGFVYAPAGGFAGADSFTYRASDGAASSNAATVTLLVSTDNRAPVAVDDAYRTTVNTPLNIAVRRGVLANDTDADTTPLQAALVDDVTHGTLTLQPTGAFSYIPDPGFSGQDSFTYTATDGTTTSAPATVTITVVVANSPPQIVSGAMAFEKKVLDDTVDETHFVVAGDFDNDGDIDVAATDYVDGAVMWYENDGNSNFTARVLDADVEGAYPAAVGDVDSDGDTDILVGGYLGDIYVWYRNDGGGTLVRQVIDANADGAHSIIAIDMDGDGDMDLVTANQDGDTIGWYENDGAENFTLHVVDAAAIDAKRAEAADVDGDGDMDIIAAIFETDEIAWYENDGNFNFTKRVVNATADGAYYVTAADMDGDGDLDLLSASQYANRIMWHRNDGTGGFTSLFVDTDAPGARTVRAVDVDRDGDLDAVGNSVVYDSIAWYKNDGTGNFTEITVDANVDGAYGVFALDVDHDGDIDLFSAGRDDDKVSLYTQFRTHSLAAAAGAATSIGPTLLNTIDADNSPDEIVYTITTAPVFGAIRLDGEPLEAGGQFTQADVNAGRVAYAHAGGQVTPDEFTYAVSDDGRDGVRPATGAVSISVTSAEQTVAHLPLDEAGGTTAGDVGGLGNDGTLMNGAVFAADTGDGSESAVRLDGVDDYIDLGTVDAAGAALTLAAWLKADTFPGSAADPRLISKASGTAADDHIFMLSTIQSGSGVRLRARVQVEGTTATLVASDGALNTQQWHHAAATYDGAALRLYLDGSQVGSMALSGNVCAEPSVGVAVGAQPPGAGGNHFDGLIDDVRILTRAMADTEIAQIAQAGR